MTIEQCIDCEDGVLTGKDEGGSYCETCGFRASAEQPKPDREGNPNE